MKGIVTSTLIVLLTISWFMVLNQVGLFKALELLVLVIIGTSLFHMYMEKD